MTAAGNFGAAKIVMPRELSLDEMKLMGEACAPNMSLECFVHGALCYCVSGRCYWSSYLGGKSGLRGRCVQPCRRVYRKNQEDSAKSSSEMSGRFFSCQDLELGVLVKTLLKVPRLNSWKIEGRKKGPHYVFHTVTAYRILRDYPNDSKKRAMALELLEMALGRPGVKAFFLSQRPVKPMRPEQHTSSGLLAGKITFDQQGRPQLKPRMPLFAKDWLRIGIQDERWHATHPVRRNIPKRGTLTLSLPRHKTPPLGTPVYLVDRRETDLEKLLAEWQNKLLRHTQKEKETAAPALKLPQKAKFCQLPDLWVSHDQAVKACCKNNCRSGIWLSGEPGQIKPEDAAGFYYWLPPDIWPDTQEKFLKQLKELLRKGAKNFVCNAPWQISLFPEGTRGLNLIAGPFCNIANGLAIKSLADAGFSAAFASPELSGRDLLQLPSQSCLPLGLVIKGNFPVGISRFGLSGLEAGEVFSSPKGEQFWSREFNGTTWIFPAWPLDLSEKRRELQKAGYSFFAMLQEQTPRLSVKDRPGLFNWAGELA